MCAKFYQIFYSFQRVKEYNKEHSLKIYGQISKILPLVTCCYCAFPSVADTCMQVHFTPLLKQRFHVVYSNAYLMQIDIYENHKTHWVERDAWEYILPDLFQNLWWSIYLQCIIFFGEVDRLISSFVLWNTIVVFFFKFNSLDNLRTPKNHEFEVLKTSIHKIPAVFKCMFTKLILDPSLAHHSSFEWIVNYIMM